MTDPLEARIAERDALVAEIRRRAIALCPDLKDVSHLHFRRKLNSPTFRVLLSALDQATRARTEEDH